MRFCEKSLRMTYQIFSLVHWSGNGATSRRTLWRQFKSLPLSHCQIPSKKHTTGGIPRWSPTLVLVARFSAYVWQSGRDAQFSLTYGRMCKYRTAHNIYLYDQHGRRSLPSSESNRPKSAFDILCRIAQPTRPPHRNTSYIPNDTFAVLHKHPHARKMLGRSRDSSEQ